MMTGGKVLVKKEDGTWSAVSDDREQNTRIPTADGEEGQVWTAGADGTGSWQAPAGGDRKIYTGPITDLISAYNNTSNAATLRVLRDFEIHYIGWVDGQGVCEQSAVVRTGLYEDKLSKKWVKIGATVMWRTGHEDCVRSYIYPDSSIPKVTVFGQSGTQLTSPLSGSFTTSTEAYYMLYV